MLGQTKIISDERTNSLLIYAGKDDMKTIKEIVSKLDVVLAQVLIEAAIISVTLTDSRDLGISYLQHPQNSGQLDRRGGHQQQQLPPTRQLRAFRGHQRRRQHSSGFQLLDVLGPGPGCDGDGGGGQQPRPDFAAPPHPDFA